MRTLLWARPWSGSKRHGPCSHLVSKVRDIARPTAIGIPYAEHLTEEMWVSVGAQTGHLTQTLERTERLLCHPNFEQKKRVELSKKGKEKQFGTAGTACEKLGGVRGNMIKLGNCI